MSQRTHESVSAAVEKKKGLIFRWAVIINTTSRTFKIDWMIYQRSGLQKVVQCMYPALSFSLYNWLPATNCRVPFDVVQKAIGYKALPGIVLRVRCGAWVCHMPFLEVCKNH